MHTIFGQCDVMKVHQTHILDDVETGIKKSCHFYHSCIICVKTTHSFDFAVNLLCSIFALLNIKLGNAWAPSVWEVFSHRDAFAAQHSRKLICLTQWHILLSVSGCAALRSFAHCFYKHFPTIKRAFRLKKEHIWMKGMYFHCVQWQQQNQLIATQPCHFFFF